MAVSVQQLRQERDQQASLLRALPGDKDDAAVAVRKRISQLDRQIQAAENPPPPPKKGGAALWVIIILLTLILLIGGGFLGGYLGGQALNH